MSEALEATAKLYGEAALELDRAARHCEVAAQHFRDNLFRVERLMRGLRVGTSSKPTRCWTRKRASTHAAPSPRPGVA
jgi:hypothetical protein